MYAAANRILGNIVKVTPSSKVVGDLALALVGANADPADFEANPTEYDIPDSVIGFLYGELGDPPGGWPEPFRTKALQGRTSRPRVDRALRRGRGGAAAEAPDHPEPAALPRPDRGLRDSRARPTPTSPSSAPASSSTASSSGVEHEVDLEPGKRLLLGLQSVSDADERGMRTVMCTLNGQLRPVQVRDESVAVDVKAAEKADPGQPGPRRGPVLRRGQPGGRGGRHRRGRRRGRDHRGDEDGGQHHHPRRRHRRSGSPSAPSSRSRAATSSSSSPPDRRASQDLNPRHAAQQAETGTPGYGGSGTAAHERRCPPEQHRRRNQREHVMGLTDKIENATEDMHGKAKEAAGKATDNERLEAEGKVDQSKADLKQAGEKVKDAFKRLTTTQTRSKRAAALHARAAGPLRRAASATRSRPRAAAAAAGEAAATGEPARPGGARRAA